MANNEYLLPTSTRIITSQPLAKNKPLRQNWKGTKEVETIIINSKSALAVMFMASIWIRKKGKQVKIVVRPFPRNNGEIELPPTRDAIDLETVKLIKSVDTPYSLFEFDQNQALSLGTKLFIGLSNAVRRFDEPFFAGRRIVATSLEAHISMCAANGLSFVEMCQNRRIITIFRLDQCETCRQKVVDAFGMKSTKVENEEAGKVFCHIWSDLIKNAEEFYKKNETIDEKGELLNSTVDMQHILALLKKTDLNFIDEIRREIEHRFNGILDVQNDNQMIINVEEEDEFSTSHVEPEFNGGVVKAEAESTGREEAEKAQNILSEEDFGANTVYPTVVENETGSTGEEEAEETVEEAWLEEDFGAKTGKKADVSPIIDLLSTQSMPLDEAEAETVQDIEIERIDDVKYDNFTYSEVYNSQETENNTTGILEDVEVMRQMETRKTANSSPIIWIQPPSNDKSGFEDDEDTKPESSDFQVEAKRRKFCNCEDNAQKNETDSLHDVEKDFEIKMNPVVSNANTLVWKFEKVEELTDDAIFSDKFNFENIYWRIKIRTSTKNSTKYLSIVLYHDNSNKEENNWICMADVACNLINQKEKAKKLSKKFVGLFEAGRSGLGYEKFIEWEKLETDGYLKDNSIIIKIDLSFNYYDFSKNIPNFTNITINVNGTKFYINKGFLCSQSKYFFNYFEKEQNQETTINVDENVEDFRYFIASFYPSLQHVQLKNIEKLMKLSMKYEVATIQSICQQFLMSNTELTLVDKLKLSEKHDFQRIVKFCLESIDTPQEIKELIQSDEYSTLHELTKAAIIKRVVDFI